MNTPANGLKWKFSVDRGGTFTDVVAVDPAGKFHSLKLLSSSSDYKDASIEGIRRILGIKTKNHLPEDIIEGIRFGTTVATNALLEKKGGKVALLITRGFGDILEIGYQARQDIFNLVIEKPANLYSKVIEVNERVDSQGNVIKELDKKEIEKIAKRLQSRGIDTVAVVLIHSWKNHDHELMCEKVLRETGIDHIYLSHKTINMIKIVSRGQSTVVDAYLGPVMHKYLDGIRAATGQINIEFIQSSGALSRPEYFLGKDAILSGPAGGVIAVAHVAEEIALQTANRQETSQHHGLMNSFIGQPPGCIGFDMGGTSTDLSRYDGELDIVYEKMVEGIELQKEMLNIKAVASGGGSILHFDGQRMMAGPESAGADPGPACYGFGGPLTVTDANLLTGRITAEYFPNTFGVARRSPIDRDIVVEKFRVLTSKINSAFNQGLSPEKVALGFLRVTNEKMALAIKEISVSKGFDVREYSLVCFGGAGGQHACQVASLLDMKTVILHPLGGVMSAYGIGLAKPSGEMVKTILNLYSPETYDELKNRFGQMEAKLLNERYFKESRYSIKRELDLRPTGTDKYLTVELKEYEKTIASFIEKHKQYFGFYDDKTAIELVNIRVKIQEEREFFPPYKEERKRDSCGPVAFQKIHYDDGVIDAPLYIRESLAADTYITGPAIIVDNYSTIIIDPGFEATIDKKSVITLKKTSVGNMRKVKEYSNPDPVLLEVFNNLFMSISTEMGHTLKNTAHSVNIKERLDFSCAIFDQIGNLVANAPHIPVHLGSMSDSVKAVIEDHEKRMKAGDIYLTNNPYRGGSHLPDLTTVCPVFSKAGELRFFVASRGHHADIGGKTPGSMPATSSHIEEEGILINSRLIVIDNTFLQDEIVTLLSDHKYPARNIDERISDLKAQIASCHRGVEGTEELILKYGWATVNNYMGHIQKNAEYSIKTALNRFLGNKKTFEGKFEDYLDDGTPIKVKIKILGGKNPPDTLKAVIDFTGTGEEHKNDNLNAPLSVTRSAVLYVLRCITLKDIPLNSGCLAPVEIIVPEASILNPKAPSPVASGNVETSQRIVDVMLGALGAAAASQGTMNNLLFQVTEDVPYYETIAGGSGALDGFNGASGVQVHMTNTRITDPEVLEFRHGDIRIERFSLRPDSGGAGKQRGGDGVVREIRFLKPAEVSVISERRVYSPYGLKGGKAGKSGRNRLKRKNGEIVELEHRFNLNLEEGESIIIETPGGGGYGKEAP